MKPSNDPRREQGAAWAASTLHRDTIELATVSGDASFRRYFRFPHDDRTLILMDAPPDKEDSSPFLDVAGRLRSAGLQAPEILHFDLQQGFGLLEDFGDTLYRGILDETTAAELFPGLMDVLAGFAQRVDSAGLPPYDADFLQFEMGLFTEWYLARHKNYTLTPNQQETWREACRLLVDSALEQQQVFVHRDFHSCNLLATASGPGIIDFQDGMHGPLAYDLASLLWDRYISWPRPFLDHWMEQFRLRVCPGLAPTEWIRHCDWIGLQRNLKIVGIFARLYYRDGKQGYLEMIPQFHAYLLDVTARYPEMSRLKNLLESPECAP